MVDEPLADEHDRDERRPYRRELEDGNARHGGVGVLAQPRSVHSSSPRRIASATAAARSDTPSFS